MTAQLVRCNINTYCKFCKASGNGKVKCTVKAKYRAHDHYKHFSCDEHKHLIEDTDPDGMWEKYHSPEEREKRKAQEREELRRDRAGGHSEADYQTWMRI